ncbi:MAG: ABC transporter permease [Deltaproteobacteria bacterium]|nr:ABC transporter permease [Deltaproteobacteria bacterium]
MSFELFISLRYLRAKRKQIFVSIITFISIAGIFLGVAALIIVLAVMNGFETDLRNKILGINSHVVLMKFSGAMKDYPKIMSEIANVEGVVASTPFIYSQAMLKSGNRTSGVVLRGMSVDTAPQVINLGKMQEGGIHYLSEKPQDVPGLPKDASLSPGIVIGKELAKNMGLSLFDPVSIISPMGISTPMGMVPKMKKFILVGIFDSGFYEYDSTLAYISLKDCQEFLNLGEEVTGLEIKVNDIYQANVIAKSLERKLGFPFWARHWMEMNKNLFAALKLEKRVMFIILSLIVLVAAFNPESIMKIFIYQGMTIGVIGTLLGCLGGLSVAFNLEKISVFIENLFGFKILPGDVYYLSQLPSQVNYIDVLIIITGTMLICFLSTIYPSRKASKLDPAEALRYE